MEILWEEEGFQFGFKRWQRSCGSEFQMWGPKQVMWGPNKSYVIATSDLCLFIHASNLLPLNSPPHSPTFTNIMASVASLYICIVLTSFCRTAQIISFFSLYYFPSSRLFVCMVVFGCLSFDASYFCHFLWSGWWCKYGFKYGFFCISIEYVSFYNAFRALDAKWHLRSFLCVADERQGALYYINVLCYGRAAMLVGILL